MSYIGRTPTNAALIASDLADGIVGTTKIAADAVTAAKIADNAVVTAAINADAVTDAKIADDVVGTEHLTANEVDTAALGADAVTSAELADDAVDSEHYTDGSIDTAHLADGQVTIGKLATAVLTGATDIGAAIVDADLLLIDDGAGGTLRKTAASRLKTYIGAGSNLVPSFSAYRNNAQNIDDNTATKVAFDAEVYDEGGVYDASSNFRFTPGVAGKYYIQSSLSIGLVNGGDRMEAKIYKNGSLGGPSGVHEYLSDTLRDGTAYVTGIVILDDDDYIEIFVIADAGGQASINATGSGQIRSSFEAFKLI